ncbi:MAG: porphobilinogen synthase, partial [Simkaniaceae bacterium]|nr:porphobilinogen synthase [Simkaniaceae bacterium]
MKLIKRPRRNRKNSAIRSLVQETHLSPADFITPFFLCAGENCCEPIVNFPGVARLSRDLILREAEKLHAAGVQAIALFPQIDQALKDDVGSESRNEKGLLPQAIRWLKHEIPSLMVIADIALDPYTTHGHDGVLKNGDVENDATVELLCEQALCLA